MKAIIAGRVVGEHDGGWDQVEDTKIVLYDITLNAEATALFEIDSVVSVMFDYNTGIVSVEAKDGEDSLYSTDLVGLLANLPKAKEEDFG